MALVILILNKCGSNSLIPDRPEVIARDSTSVNFHKETTKTEWDTLIIEGQIVNIPTYIHDTILLPTEPIPSWMDTFCFDIDDSFIKAKISAYAENKPFISFDYELKIPEKTVTNTVKDSAITTITEKVRVNQVYYGIEAVVYPNFQAMFVGVDFVSKKGWQVEVGAGVDVTGKSLIGKAGFKWLLTTRKKE